MNRILLSSVAVVLGVSSASADTKSWAALKTNVPTNSETLVGFDIKALRAVPSLAKVLDGIPEVGPALGIIKSACGIDATAVVSDVTLSVKTKGPDEIIIAVGLDGVDEAKLVDCAGKIAKMQSAKAKVTAKSRKISEYTIDDGKDKHTVYATWPTKDVVVFTAKPDTKASLDAYTGGKAAQGDMATVLGKVSTTGIAWVAATIGEDHIKGAYGSATLAKGTITGTMRMMTDSAKDAANLAKEGTTGVSELMADKKTPAEIVTVLKAIKIAVSGSDVTVDGSIADASLAAVLPAIMKM